MTPRQARAARAMLSLDMKSVCRLADVSERTLGEYEGGKRAVNSVTEAKLKAFYITSGIAFTQTPHEGVWFTSDSRGPLAPDTQARGLREFYDILGVIPIKAKIATLDKSLQDIGNRASSSQALIRYLMSQTRLNQKELAARLGCTPAFINAIYVGKKAMPIAFAENVQQMLPELTFDAAVILERDKLMRKLDAQMRDCINAFYEALDAVAAASPAHRAG